MGTAAAALVIADKAAIETVAAVVEFVAAAEFVAAVVVEFVAVVGSFEAYQSQPTKTKQIIY